MSRLAVRPALWPSARRSGRPPGAAVSARNLVRFQFFDLAARDFYPD